MTDLSTSNLKHLLAESTPGPWEVDQFEQQLADCPEVTEFYLYSEDTQYIAKGEAVSKYRDREEANFQLIALAPPLAQEVIRLRKGLQAVRSDLHESALCNGGTDVPYLQGITEQAVETHQQIAHLLGDTE